MSCGQPMSPVPRAELDRVQAHLDETLFVLAHIVEHGDCASDCSVWWRAEQLLSAVSR